MGEEREVSGRPAGSGSAPEGDPPATGVPSSGAGAGRPDSLAHGLLTLFFLGMAALVVASAPLALGVWAMARFDAEENRPDRSESRWIPPPEHRGRSRVFLVDPVDGEVRNGVVLDYRGKYAGDPDFRKRVEALVEDAPGALESVRRRLGLTEFPSPRVRVRLRDAVELTYPNWMAVYQEIHGEEVWQTVVVRTEDLAAGMYDPAFLLRHEFAHCCQLAAMGEDSYRLPKWVREGLADWATEDGRERLRQLYLDLAGNPSLDPVRSLIDGLEGHHDNADYGESYLAFAMIEEEFGEEAVRRVSQEVVRHGNHAVAIQRATGLAMPRFLQRARAWAIDRVRRDLEDRDEFLVGKRRLDAGEYDRAASAYEEFLARAGGGFLRPVAWMDLGVCRYELGDAEGAAAALREARDAAPFGPLSDRLRFLEIRMADRAGRKGETRDLCRAFLKDYARTGSVFVDDVRLILELLERYPRQVGEDDPMEGGGDD